MLLGFTSAQLTAPRDSVLTAEYPLQPHNTINVVTQVRRTMPKEDIAELALSIADQGQHAAGDVVFQNDADAKQYLNELNELWGTNYQLSHMVPVRIDAKHGYLFAIAGHRRLEAVQLANRMVADFYLPGKKFTGKYLCHIHFGLSVEEAVAIQFHENRHQQVPLQEEVAAALCTYRFMKKRHPDMTNKAFSKVVGRGTGWVTNLLRFSTLPLSAQNLIEANGDGLRVPYTLLYEVARLVEAETNSLNEAEQEGYTISARRWTEESILSFINHLIVRRVKPDEFSKEVSRRIDELKSGQGDLLFGEVEEVSLRKVAVPELIKAVHSALAYWHNVEILRRIGAFDVDGTPFASKGKSEYSPQSVIRLALKNLEVLYEIMPHLTVLALQERRYSRLLKRSAKRMNVAMAVFESIALAEAV